MIRRFSMYVAAALLLAACSGSAPRSSGQGSDRNAITAADMARVQGASVYDVVQALRPHFLQRRGAVSLQSPDAGYAIVYIDNVRAGDLNQLRSIPPTVVDHIQFISAAEATTRWGTGHPGGVIAIRTKR